MAFAKVHMVVLLKTGICLHAVIPFEYIIFTTILLLPYD